MLYLISLNLILSNCIIQIYLIVYNRPNYFYSIIISVNFGKTNAMALSLNFSANISDDGTSIAITETTGVYAANNIGGWGDVNPEIADVETATISISQLTDADSGKYSDPVVIDVFDTLPNIDGTVFDITAEDAGYGVNYIFPDAIYKIIYTVTGDNGDPFTATKEKSFVFTHNIDCAVKKAGSKVAICTCNCQSLIDYYNELYVQQRLMNAATCCGNLVQIFNYITLITNIINDSNCGC